MEHELDQAEWTYRDACDQLTRKADELEQQATPSIVEALQGVIDAQLGEFLVSSLPPLACFCSLIHVHSSFLSTLSHRLCDKLHKHVNIDSYSITTSLYLCLAFDFSHSFSFILDSTISSLSLSCYENESIPIGIFSTPERTYTVPQQLYLVFPWTWSNEISNCG